MHSESKTNISPIFLIKYLPVKLCRKLLLVRLVPQKVSPNELPGHLRTSSTNSAAEAFPFLDSLQTLAHLWFGEL